MQGLPLLRLRHVWIAVLLCVSIVMGITGVYASNEPGSNPYRPDQTVWNGLYIKSHRVSVEVTNQVAVTRIEQVFRNDGAGLAEGEYLFPLPDGAAVSDLTLTIDGVVYEAQILDAQEAQQIYTEIVRRQRDPVLLQYVGRSAIRANIFPIPAGQERKIEITYSQLLNPDNGLLQYTYPLRTDYVTKLPVQQVSVSMRVTSQTPISTLYAPSPLVTVSRIDDRTFVAGLEATNYRAVDDFAVYYGGATDAISANLVTYRASANEDGYFVLFLNAPMPERNQVIPKDVIIVLDQSGSMLGEKWRQAQAAANFILNGLNPEDRFNAVVFSTGYRIYANTLQPVSEAPKAAQWINSLEAVGGTDINAGLQTALGMADPARQTVILFLTDGLPTEGVTDARSILANFGAKATPNTRLFAFGVGDDVDTFLLDSLSSAYGGTSVYVRPMENIETKVSSLYSKITSPVMTALDVQFTGIMADDLQPNRPFPDVFAGSQLIIAGRFRDTDGDNSVSVILTGQRNGAPVQYQYSNLNFPQNAGGDPFVARLWATRKVGALLNTIRLNGETPELVDSVVQLSLRYGIITPYTSFLIREDDAVTGERPPSEPVPVLGAATQAAAGGFAATPLALLPTAGADAVGRADSFNSMEGGANAAAVPTSTAAATMSASIAGSSANTNTTVLNVRDRTFVNNNGIWNDTLFTPGMTLNRIVFLSDEYFALLAENPEIAEFLAVGDHLVLVVDGVAYEIVPQA
jgi:Ca-activated chloride channel homolog